MATLCDLATRLPLVIGGLLDRETNLKRGRFREETMTDILTGALAAFAGPELVISYRSKRTPGVILICGSGTCLRVATFGCGSKPSA